MMKFENVWGGPQVNKFEKVHVGVHGQTPILWTEWHTTENITFLHSIVGNKMPKPLDIILNVF